MIVEDINDLKKKHLSLKQGTLFTMKGQYKPLKRKLLDWILFRTRYGNELKIFRVIRDSGFFIPYEEYIK